MPVSRRQHDAPTDDDDGVCQSSVVASQEDESLVGARCNALAVGLKSNCKNCEIDGSDAHPTSSEFAQYG
jgi:hypothetical protein